MNYIGKSCLRVDAIGKVNGVAKYTADIAPHDCYIAKVLHSTIGNGEVLNFDLEDARKIDGIIDIFTCFDVPDIEFPTAGHPYSLDASHRDITDRLLLNKRVRYYGDGIAVVVAINEISANKALKMIKVQYKQYDVFTTTRQAMQDTSNILHPNISKNNIIQHINFKTDNEFNYNNAKKLAIDKYGANNIVEISKNVKTQLVSHCHLELPISFAYIDTNGKITVVCSTQIPDIIRRCVAHALGVSIGKVRIIKPYIGGGFGNKQDALYEPLNAWLTTKLGGHAVLLEISREDTITSTRTRHMMDADIKGLCTKNGKLLCRTMKNYVANGGYANHGNSITAKCAGIFKNLYKDEFGCNSEAWTVYTNTPTSGAMRTYGVPQSIYFIESLVDELCYLTKNDPYKFRMENLVESDFTDGNVRFYSYGLKGCLKVGHDFIKYDELKNKYKNQSCIIRSGVGCACFMYQTAVWPISLEVSGVRMILN